MTPLRSIRVATDLWQSVQAKAKEEGTTVSAVITKALREYIKYLGNEKPPAGTAAGGFSMGAFCA